MYSKKKLETQNKIYSLFSCLSIIWATLEAQLVKNLPAMGRPEFDPWVGKIPREEGMATHSSIIQNTAV